MKKYKLTEEQKETIASEHFTEIPAIINSGIMCEDGLYYNATSVLFVDLCKAFNNKTKTETTIVNVLDNKWIKNRIYLWWVWDCYRRK